MATLDREIQVNVQSERINLHIGEGIDSQKYVTKNQKDVQILWNGKAVRNITGNPKMEESIAIKVDCGGRE